MLRIKLKWFHSLRLQLFVLFFLVSAIPFMFFASLTTGRIEAYFLEDSKAEWMRQANLVVSQIIQTNNYLKEGTNYTIFTNKIRELSQSEEVNARIIVVDPLGYVVADSSRIDLNTTLLNTQIFNALNKKNSSERYEKAGNFIMSTAVSIIDKEDNDKVLGAVLLSASINDIYKLLEDMESQIYFLSLIASLVIGLLSFFSSSIITRPIKTLMKVVQRVTNGQLDQKVKLNGKGEMAELANAFNHMTEQLQLVDQSRQEFVSDVSHELKTPLSSIKVLTESLMCEEDVPVEMYKEFFYDINSEVDRLNVIITDLLLLVKLDRTEIMLNINETNIKHLIANILKRLSPLARKKDIEMIYEANKEIYAEVDEVKLTLAISNIIENGIKYTPEGGQVKVKLQSDMQDVFIEVEDTGIGIAKEEQGRIFERFYRTDKTRSRDTGGTGLGLSITYRTIIMHTGSIQVESEEGIGSTFVIQIPIKHV
ncbi:histidine kinase [Candidatus Epulonipiscium fishelsonii]|uniref:Histidine kinase n=1 Tax=Candidatus Epulonipiscium fishelsonii TaxID=77094 RepID=A0ACC8X7K7_9FIRM|nr:histidine kinase [Epulopiscium sp. SCG-B11WGA-EpuloA1]ONI41383.1 histidine kinase [Epulopiscium sp. SCG-B05WGA-EpuloA1]